MVGGCKTRCQKPSWLQDQRGVSVSQGGPIILLRANTSLAQTHASSARFETGDICRRCGSPQATTPMRRCQLRPASLAATPKKFPYPKPMLCLRLPSLKHIATVMSQGTSLKTSRHAAWRVATRNGRHSFCGTAFLNDPRQVRPPLEGYGVSKEQSN